MKGRTEAVPPWRRALSPAIGAVLLASAAIGGLTVERPSAALGAAQLSSGSGLSAGHGGSALAAKAAATKVGPTAAVVAPLRPDCRGGSVASADALLNNRYKLGTHPVVTLPANPVWNENPLHSRNWEYQYHTLRFVLDLLTAGENPGGQKYLDRASFLLRDWVRDNPPAKPRSVFAWNDHATAWRGDVLVCASEILPFEPWLRNALIVHGAMLAKPAFYTGAGNHALNQNVALLDIGCRLSRPAWIETARWRLARLVVGSVDAQGVTNEQAVFYQLYNWRNYDRAGRLLDACGVARPPELARIARMPEFLVHATLPNGYYVGLGDTGRTRAMAIAGTTAEYAATLGKNGPQPTTVFARYRAGFIFGRSGWGRTRPFEDESAYSVRFGRRQWHGHADGGSVTLFARRTRMLEDPGTFTLNYNAWRTYAVGRSAHNVVTIDGRRFNDSLPTTVERATSSPGGDEILLRLPGYAGIAATRRIVYSRGLGYLLVEDRLRSSVPIVARQLWHLAEDARPVVHGTSVGSNLSSPHARVIQLTATGKPVIVTGRRTPIQGWLSFYTDQWTPAPCIEVPARGRSIRYVTIVVPTPAGDEQVSVTNVRLTPAGFSFVITVAGRAERVTATAFGATVGRRQIIRGARRPSIRSQLPVEDQGEAFAP